MSSLTFPPLKTLAGFATDKPLSDSSLPSSPVALGLNSPSETIPVPDPANAGATLGSFVITAGDSSSVAIINSSSDPDPIGYFNLGKAASPAAENPANAPLIEAPITFDPTLAYVVVTGLSVSGKLAGNFTIGAPVALGLDGSATLDASACMAFPKGNMAWAALTAAAGNFKTVFSVAELLALVPAGPAPWQVLSFGIQTELTLSLKLTATSWASLVADSVNAVLDLGTPFSFTASPAATITVTAGATDGFRLFAFRAAGGGTTFSIKKSLSTSLGLSAGVGLNIAIAETDLNDLVNTVFDQLGGVVAGTVQSILTAGASPGSVLTDAQQQAVQGIVAKLGLSSVVTSGLQSLQSKITSFKSDLTKRIGPTLSAQFTYSWQRLTSQSLVAQFNVPDVVLPKYHADILSLDLTELMNVGAADGVVFSRFLGQATQEIDIGYGFSFGIAGYTFLKSWDSLQDKFVELDSNPGGGALLKQYSFLGKRGYSGSWLSTSQAYYVELDASTSVPLASPDASDFQAGLSVAFSWTSCGFRDILNTVADYGAVLDALDSDDVLVASQSLTDAGLPLDATGDAVVSLTITDAVLRQLLPTLAGPDYGAKIAPYAMARALPFDPTYAERKQVNLRTQAYAQIFANFLVTEDLSSDTMAKLCGDGLAGPGVSAGLAAAERTLSVGWTAQSVVAMASAEDLQDAVVNQVPSCFSYLQLRTGDFRTLFPSCVSDYSELAAQSYGSRIFACMLVLAAMINPVWLAKISRSVQFTWKDASGSHVIVVKQGSP